MTRKLTALMLGALLLLGLFAGCSGNDSTNTTAKTTANSAATTQAAKTTAATTTTATTAAANYYNDPGTLPIVKEPLEMTFGVPQSATIEDFETNEFTRFLTEQTGIQFVFELYPSAEYLTKVDLMMAAGGGDMPEVLFGATFSLATLANWGKAGHILALNDYYGSLAHHLPAALNACADIDYESALTMVTTTDGNLYGMPTYAEQPNDRVSLNRTIMYKPWLEELDMEVPATLEAYRAYLEAVRDSDMNGNGNLSDEIPLTGCRDTLSVMKSALLSPFLMANGMDPWYMENGEVKFNYNRDEYADALAFIKGLVDDGLLDPLAFSQDGSQMNALITGDIDLVGAYLRASQTNIPATDPRYLGFACYAYALAGPDGQRYNSYAPAVPSIRYLITKNCEHPEAAFLLGDYMSTEECSYINRYGFEGKDWFPVNEAEGKYINPYGNDLKRYNASNALWGKPQNIWWGNMGVSILSNRLMTATSIENDPEAVLTIYTLNVANSSLDAMTYTDRSRVFNTPVYNEEETEILQEIWSPINTYIEECFSRFCLSDMDIEKDWQEYCDTIQKMDLDTVRTAIQGAYDRSYK